MNLDKLTERIQEKSSCNVTRSTCNDDLKLTFDIAAHVNICITGEDLLKHPQSKEVLANRILRQVNADFLEYFKEQLGEINP